MRPGEHLRHRFADGAADLLARDYADGLALLCEGLVVAGEIVDVLIGEGCVVVESRVTSAIAS
jgi:hypothetical protein